MMKKYDLHIHSNKSSCSNLTPGKILKTAKKRKLNGIAVVDHNTIAGALKVKKANKDRNFEVIVGAEIKTKHGEIIGLYLKKEIKSRNIFKVIEEIKKQKGLVIVPHPFTYGILRKGAKSHLLKIKDKIDAIESRNCRCMFKSENIKASKFAKKYKLAVTAGSDAHFASEIGGCYTVFNGDLRTALKKKTTKAYGKLGFALFWRSLSLIEKIKRKFKCKNCRKDLDF